MSDDPSAAPADPFSAAKANLRDTVKWLATTLAALAAAVLAGISLAGVSSLSESVRLYALAAAGGGLICVLIAIGTFLRLLTSESFFLRQLEEKPFGEVRKRLGNHADDVLSPTFKSLDQFLKLREEAIADIRNDCDSAQAKEKREAATKFFEDIADDTSRLVNLAHFEVLRANLVRSEALLFVMAVGAILGIGTFGVLAGTGKAPAPTASTMGRFDLSAGSDWSGIARAFAATCGNPAAIKAEVENQPQLAWVRVRLLSPDKCAGMELDLPGKFVVVAAAPKP